MHQLRRDVVEGHGGVGAAILSVLGRIKLVLPIPEIRILRSGNDNLFRDEGEESRFPGLVPRVPGGDVEAVEALPHLDVLGSFVVAAAKTCCKSCVGFRPEMPHGTNRGDCKLTGDEIPISAHPLNRFGLGHKKSNEKWI